MVLTTHAVVGASVASLFPSHPVIAFIGGFLSHFLLDSIPHWDYKVLSMETNSNDKMDTDMKIGKKFFFDFLRIGTDMLLGIIIGLTLFYDSPAFPFGILLGILGGVFPDFLQFVYFKFKHFKIARPLIPLQKFHIFLNESKLLKSRPVLGIFCQIGVVVIVYSIISVINDIV